MDAVSCKNLFFILLILSVGIGVKAESCKEILPRLPGALECDVENCKGICRLMHGGTAQCVDVFKKYERCICVWDC
ncbi:hypothetical protein M5689_015420 [Euphorbia peplus]|nr:hypothetical protein M5689_015420 [Euphorbia peplus]